MIGQIITDPKTGKPIDGNGKVLATSVYNPSTEVKKLFQRVQSDYQIAWALQNRNFNEFDGMSLLQRARVDQQTFGAFVGANYVPQQKQWRWRGRKNTARNKIIGILAHVISGMLYPFVYAYNEENKEDKMTAKVMRILVENHLKKADYEMKFLFMMCSALVNPAVFVEVEYVEAIQKVKVRNEDGTYRIEEAVDELLSGINLNIIPIDSILLGDFYTFDLQRQPYIVRVRRISYDEARSIYAGKYFVDGKDQFDYVSAGVTRVVMSGQDNQTLYDIDWTEADGDFVQVINIQYRSEDLEVEFVAGIFMGEDKNVYNSNPFKHRRMSVVKNEYITIPVYPYAKSGFEPLDPSGRFAYYKSAAFKEFWDDASQNKMYQLAQDGTYLDVIKPQFISGIAKSDSSVMVPGAVVALPQGATVSPYQLGPNLQAALNMMRVNQEDMSLSTQDALQSGVAEKGVTATASLKAEQNAKVIMNVFSTMISGLVRDVGDLIIDDIVCHTTIGEVDATIPDNLKMKFRTVRLRGKENGKDVTNHIEFSTDMMGESFNHKQANELEWKMFEDNGGMEATTMHYKCNPYKLARTQYSTYVDPQQIISRSMGTDQLRKDRAINLLLDPRIAPFIDQEAVVDKFILEDYSDGDPDQFKKKVPPGGDLLDTMMGQNQQNGGQVVPPQALQGVQR